MEPAQPIDPIIPAGLGEEDSCLESNVRVIISLKTY